MSYFVFLLLASLFSALVYICYIWWYQKCSRFFRILNKIPGPPGYPIIGNVAANLTPHQMFQQDREDSKTYYPIYKQWSLNLGGASIMHPDDIEIVLSNMRHNDKSQIYDFLQCWLGTGLLTSGGAKWHSRRKILTPAFHFSILQEFIGVFNEESNKLVEQIKNICQDPIDIIPEITQYTLLSIAETSMGIKLTEQNNDYKTAIYNFGEALTYRVSRPWLFTDFLFYLTSRGATTKKATNILHDFSMKVIKERRQNVQRISYSTSKRKAMLDLLLSAQEDGANIDDEGIREEVDTFMFEGHDTTSVALCYALMLLANNKKEQDEIYDELKAILGDPSTATPSYNDLKELTYMERCLKEVLRLYPSVPFISRLIKEDTPTATGYTIPAGGMAHIHIYDLHHNSTLFPDPEKFDPDRFLPENSQNRHPFAYLPFSAGPRNCIGQKYAMLELKIAICKVLGSFQLEPITKPEDIKILADLVLRPEGAINVKFNLRK